MRVEAISSANYVIKEMQKIQSVKTSNPVTPVAKVSKHDKVAGTSSNKTDDITKAALAAAILSSEGIADSGAVAAEPLIENMSDLYTSESLASSFTSYEHLIEGWS